MKHTIEIEMDDEEAGCQLRIGDQIFTLGRYSLDVDRPPQVNPDAGTPYISYAPGTVIELKLKGTIISAAESSQWKR